MSGGGGSTESKTEVPKYITQASQANIGRARDVERIGYTPYYGPDVAAFTPMQQASFQNTGQAANAFGMAGGGLLGMEGVPQAQEFAGGQMGYSSAPLFQQSVDQLAARNPEQYRAISDLFVGQGQATQPMTVQGNSGMGGLK